MKLIILAAGRGSRMGKRTENLPKCMCKLAGKTLLTRCLETLQTAGLQMEDIGIVTGYRSELFTIPDIHYFHNPNWASTNMFISLTMAEKWLRTESCIVCYSDIVFSSQTVRKLVDSTEPLALTYYTKFWDLWCKRMDDPLSDLETFRFNKDNYLTEIGKKPTSIQDIAGQYMGMIRFTPTSWQWIMDVIKKPLPKSNEKLDMTTLLEVLVENGHPAKVIADSGLWLECDTETDVEIYEKYYIKELS